MPYVFPKGKIAQTSSGFPKFEQIVLLRLKEITEVPARGIWSTVKRRFHFNRLNLQLALYGWQLRWDGTLFEIPVLEEKSNLVPQEQTNPKTLSCDYYGDMARNHFVETGKLINPYTGQPITKSERYRYFCE